MNTPAAHIQTLARRLLATAATGMPPQGDLELAVRACERFRVSLSRLAGTTGYSSLLARALSLAKRQAPSMDALHVAADGTLDGLDQVPHIPPLTPSDEFPTAGVLLIAELLTLMIALIGEPLALRIVREAWSDTPFDLLTFRTEENP